ncbi:MAG TPA: protein-glutamate O-methyltransferase CheR [Exilispira sp.]|nr:protein-glutamate O-methyltransferase CheR [Exilispira sp.]HQM88826.1 protein-glutamate O-methyltransferase CheR [Exilispira sp.]
MNETTVEELISRELFEKFTKLIYQLCGIYMKESKVVLLSNRLRKRLNALNIKSYEDYYDYLLSHKDEVQYFLNVISTNETYFFRSETQLEALSSVILPLIINRKGFARIWSAGCSTGEEPYSIAIVAKELGFYSKVDILATDINSDVIEAAKTGIYPERKLKYVKPEIMEKYFFKDTDDKYHIDKNLKNRITFKKHNLLTDIFPTELDIIFCRNVMIYFSRDIQKQIVKNFYNSLISGGFFFIGHAETLYAISDNFKYLKIENSSVYYKE